LRGTTNTGGSGSGGGLKTASTDAEYPNSEYQIYVLNNASVQFGSTAYYGFDTSGLPGIMWNLTRAPSFFDEVCWRGTGSSLTVNHNLTVVPELVIYKNRTNGSTDWIVGYNFTASTWNLIFLNYSDASYGSVAYSSGSTGFYAAQPTSTTLSFGTSTNANSPNLSAKNYVAYLFATCAGVSKVGTYTGNGTTQTINCGFTGGARFVLIKRTDSTGDWYVYDTARGMTTLTDPYLLLNSTSAESATLGSVTTVSTGFALNSTILAAINVSSATYIFLAIA
jgi:hypothetical protein